MARSAAKVAKAGEASSRKLPLAGAADAYGDALSGPTLAHWLGAGYALLVLIGFGVFRLPGATVRGNEMSVERAVFTVVNAATLTGFPQAVPIDDYGWRGQACVIFLTIGGTLITSIIGGLALVRLV